MATETVQPATHDKVHGQLASPGSQTDPSIHRKEKELVASVVSFSEHPLDPSAIAQDPEKKHLGISAQTLKVDDFELIRTLGTGTFI